MRKITIHEVTASDRFIIIVSDDNGLIGINYCQGLGDYRMINDFMIPDLMLTGYVVSEIEDNVKSHSLSFENPSAEMLNFIDDAIWKYFDKCNEIRTIKLPKSQIKLIRDALSFALDVGVSNEISDFREFDLMTLSALLSYDVSVSLTQRQIDRFTAEHGIDFPEYVS